MAQSAATRVLVTGATGNVGAPLIRALLALGIAVRAGLTNPTAHDAALPANAERVRLDLRDPSSFRDALHGCDALFLMRPPAIANVKDTLFPLIDEAKRQGISRVVFLSVAGDARQTFIPHYRVEAHLRQALPEATILCPGFFAQNLQRAYREDIRRDDRLYVPSGNARVAFIDARDIADVAALVFSRPERHAGQRYTLTGSQAISFADVARLLSSTLERPIHYSPASIVGYLVHNARARQLPMAQSVVQLVLHLGLRRGNAEQVDPTLGALLGRDPRRMAQYVADHAALWATPERPHTA